MSSGFAQIRALFARCSAFSTVQGVACQFVGTACNVKGNNIEFERSDVITNNHKNFLNTHISKNR